MAMEEQSILQYISNSLKTKYYVAIKASTFPYLTNKSLMSVGQFCDDGCIGIFTKEHFVITKNGKLILKGYCKIKLMVYGVWV